MHEEGAVSGAYPANLFNLVGDVNKILLRVLVPHGPEAVGMLLNLLAWHLYIRE